MQISARLFNNKTMTLDCSFTKQLNDFTNVFTNHFSGPDKAVVCADLYIYYVYPDNNFRTE